METEKARQRRLREGFFRDFIQPDKQGIDIGCGDDPVTANCIRWDKTLATPPFIVNVGELKMDLDMRPGRIFLRGPDPAPPVRILPADATNLTGIDNVSLDWVYSSHCLEDLENPWAAVKEWWRVLRRGGYMCIMVPHRDLFECRRTLPSAGNANHKTYWLPDRGEAPVTIGLTQIVASVCMDSELIYCKTCNEGYEADFRPFPSEPHRIQVIAHGEFSIEAVWRKRVPMLYLEEMILPEQLGSMPRAWENPVRGCSDPRSGTKATFT